MLTPATHYAKNGDVHIAYQVIGEGPVDLILALGLAVQMEIAGSRWDAAAASRYLGERLHLAPVGTDGKRRSQAGNAARSPNAGYDVRHPHRRINFRLSRGGA